MKILVLYTNSEHPMRKTVESLLRCYSKYSDAKVFYCNISIRRFLFFLDWTEYDLIIFPPSISIPWNESSYIKRIERLKGYKLKAKRKIAFFQDEYSNTDLMCRFVTELGIDEVWSVAPESEWPKIYRNIPANCQIYSYLTGYVDEEDVIWSKKELEKRDQNDRAIDVGYRTGWFAKDMFKLGYWGILKQRIGQLFQERAKSLTTDIQIGSGFFTGESWFHFLMNCRYTIGVESGASLLDNSGDLLNKIKAFLKVAPNASFEEVRESVFKKYDGNLNLKAISPRIFEAGMCDTGLVLVEGYYNGILKPHVHYIELKEDFSNIDEVIEDIKDEKLRQELVSNVRRDIIDSGKYSYQKFVEDVLQHSSIAIKANWKDPFLYFLNLLFEKAVVCTIILLQFSKKIKK